MTTKTIEKKLTILTEEITALRSLLLSIISDKDSEGEYKVKFVRDVAEASKLKGKYNFTNSKDFLKLLKI